MKAIFESEVYKNNGTHAELQVFAFNSHPTCYADNDFCTDILSDFDNLKCLWDTYDLADFFSLQSINQVKKLLYFNMYISYLPPVSDIR